MEHRICILGMKKFFAASILVLFALISSGANPDFRGFFGTNGIVIRTNITTGLVQVDGRNVGFPSTTTAVAISNLLWSKVRHVDATFGSVLTAAENDATKPWPSPQTATTNAEPGTVILVRPGTYNLGSNHIKLPHGVSLVGGGYNNTFLIATGASGVAGAVINPGSDSLIAGVTIDTQAQNDYTNPLGTGYSADKAFTNCVVRSVRVKSITDGLTVGSSSKCTMDVYDSSFEATWDNVRVGGADGHILRMFNCSIIVVDGVGQGFDTVPVLNNSGNTYLYGCDIVSSNTGFPAFGVQVDGTTLTNHTWLYGCRIFVSGDSTSAPFYNNTPTKAFIHPLDSPTEFTSATLTSGNYQQRSHDLHVAIPNGSARTNTLPDTTWLPPRFSVRIEDAGGTATGTNIWVATRSGQKIQYGTTETNITVNYGSITLRKGGLGNTNWVIESVFP